MLILTIRTDKPEAELELYEAKKQLAYITWEAHRQLAETIHIKLKELMSSCKKNLEGIDGVVVYEGPGSFTGLRIGVSTANALAYGLGVPIVAATDDWIEQGIKRLIAGKADKVVVPEYGREAHITSQKK